MKKQNHNIVNTIENTTAELGPRQVKAEELSQVTGGNYNGNYGGGGSNGNRNGNGNGGSGNGNGNG